MKTHRLFLEMGLMTSACLIYTYVTWKNVLNGAARKMRTAKNCKASLQRQDNKTSR